jgi:hypothetical protein
VSAPRSGAEIRYSRMVGTNIRARRTALGIGTRELAASVAAQGVRMSASVVSRIELTRAYSGQSPQAVTVDQLMAFAVALRTDPAALLASPKCEACADTPPAGFACLACGTGATR